MDNLCVPVGATDRGSGGAETVLTRQGLSGSRLRRIVFLSCTVGMLGCAGTAAAPGGPSPTATDLPGEGEAVPFTVAETPVSFTILSDSLPDDPAIEGLVAPFRASMADRISEVIGEANGLFTEARPEGSLGNFAADAVLEVARTNYSEPVDMALVNNGGLRIPLAAGPITVGQMFELMPFENLVSILLLEGSTVQTLADQIARRGGEPVAGFSFHIEEVDGERKAVNIEVGGEPLVSDQLYRLATSDFLASAGDDLSALLSARSREDLPILIRDAFIDYIRERGSIEPRVEGRITVGGQR